MKQKSLKLNAIFNAARQSISIVFPLISYPYIARVIGAGNIGRYSFADSVIQILITCACLGIPTYAVREGARIRDEKREIESFAAEMLTINLLSSIIVYGILLIMLFSVKRFQDDRLLILIIGVNIMATTLGRDWLNDIFENYLYTTIRYLVFQILSLLFIFLFVKDRQDIYVYTWIMVFANSGSLIVNLFYTKKYASFKLSTSINLKRHIKPILLLFSSSIAVLVYVRSDIILLGFFVNNADVGVYALASKVYFIIKAVLNAIIIAVIPRLVFCFGKKDYRRYYDLLIKLKKTLLILLLPVTFGIVGISREVMLLLGGDEFAGGYMSLVLLGLALSFAVFGCYYTQGILVIQGREKDFFIATVLSALINIILNLVLIPQMGINGAAITTLIAEMFVVIYSRVKCGETTARIKIGIIDAVSPLVGSIAVLLVCMIVRKNNLGTAVTLVVSIVISVIVYFGIEIVMRNSVVTNIFFGAIKKCRRFFGDGDF